MAMGRSGCTPVWGRGGALVSQAGDSAWGWGWGGACGASSAAGRAVGAIVEDHRRWKTNCCGWGVGCRRHVSSCDRGGAARHAQGCWACWIPLFFHSPERSSCGLGRPQGGRGGRPRALDRSRDRAQAALGRSNSTAGWGGLGGWAFTGFDFRWATAGGWARPCLDGGSRVGAKAGTAPRSPAHGPCGGLAARYGPRKLGRWVSNRKSGEPETAPLYHVDDAASARAGPRSVSRTTVYLHV